MSGALIAGWLRLAACRIAAERVHLTELDAAIGDGDHGINLHRGFGALAARLAAGDFATDAPGPLLVLAGRTITGTVGGASGALYGRALLRAGAVLEARPGGSVVTSAQLAAVLRAAVDAVAALGRSRPGEKTMLDALVPAVVAFEAAGAAGIDVASAMRRANRPSPLAANSRANSASGQVFTRSAAVVPSSGSIRMSRGASAR